MNRHCGKALSLCSLCLLVLGGAPRRLIRAAPQTPTRLTGEVTTAQNGPKVLAHKRVVVTDAGKNIGSYETSDSGLFVFPEPEADEIDFQVEDFVMVCPSDDDRPGHKFLFRNHNRRLEVQVFDRRNGNPSEVLKNPSVIRCTLIQAVLGQLWMSLRSSSRQLSGSGIYQPVHYSIGIGWSGQVAGTPGRAGTAGSASAGYAQQEKISQEHSEFIRKKSDEFGIEPKVFAQSIELWIRNARGLVDRSLSVLYVGDFCQGEKLLTEYLDSGDPTEDRSTNYLLLAGAQYQLGKFGLAESSLTKVLRLHPRNVPALADIEIAREAAAEAQKGTVQPAPCGSIQ
jgi:hypothetical protein